MPGWSGILDELNRSMSPGTPPSPPNFDGVRRKYLKLLNELTGHNVILYASAWLQKPGLGQDAAIMDEDMQGFMEVVHGLAGNKLDLILHSPGGSPEAAASIVSYLCSRFTDIQVFVPHLAKSAATMIACAADEIWMGSHSVLGPTDPQVLLSTPLGWRWVSALDILAQFDQAKKECSAPDQAMAWMPMMAQYGPDLLQSCATAHALSRELVGTWLERYMLKGREQTACEIADWLADRDEFKSHSRHISREELENKGVMVKRLEDDDHLQDGILSVFHATTHTFAGSDTAKIIENHKGRAFVKRVSAAGSEPT